MNKIEKNIYNLYIYSFLYSFSHYQEQVGISISSIRISIPYLVFDLGNQLNLILLLLLLVLYNNNKLRFLNYFELSYINSCIIKIEY